MTLKQLRYIVTVAETGNITEAAGKLFIAQPSLTASIQELEKEFDIRIFERGKKGISLTKEGEEFLGYARQVLDQTNLIEERYTGTSAGKNKFSVSSQHYSFAVEAFVELLRQYGGDKYETIIADAISAAKVVITVLSPNVAEDLKNDSTNHYYNKEWRIAQQFDDKTIIPLAVNGYDLRDNYHQVYKKIVNQKASGIDLMDPEGFSKLIDSIDEHL